MVDSVTTGKPANPTDWERTKLDKLLLTLTALASLVMPVIGAEPIGPVLANPTTSDQDSLILRILKAVENRDYRTSIIYKLDKETDYFGHKNSSSAFIQQDMTQDARSYKWCRFVPDLSTFQLSPGMTQRSRQRTRNA